MKWICKKENNKCSDDCICEVGWGWVPKQCLFSATNRVAHWEKMCEIKETDTSETEKSRLNTDIFNRKDCPEWAKYAAVDKDGWAFFL